MQIIESLEDIPSLTGPISLAIGNFDGVHPGHLYLISELKKRGVPVIITFRNHPAEILYRDKTPTPLCSLEKKLHFLESAGVELIILLSFTPEIASTTYDVFLKR
ncbi:MAG: adenylyltransferase/cytidyltransferase family protein [Rhabdochlamydiaceae bacterium]|jgi:riboflavin kinase/FMN adenylyltransferase